MSPLEIVMVSVAGVLAAFIVVWFISRAYFKHMAANKAEDQQFLARYAQEGGVLFLGDSLTDYFPVNEFIHCPQIYNRGIAGDTTQNVKRRLDTSLRLKPRSLFLLIGINDLIENGRKKMPAQKVVNSIMEIASSFTETPDINVISLYPVNRKRKLVSGIMLCRRANNQRVDEVNALLRQECDKRSYKFIDINSSLKDEKGNLRSEYTEEGLHLSVRGYGVVADILKEYVK